MSEESAKALSDVQAVIANISAMRFASCSDLCDCTHSKVPLRKSQYSDEMLQLGKCPECGMHLQELD